MAPSRLNAKVIRDAEVMHEVAQKNCADAEMNSTERRPVGAERRARRSAATPPPASALSGWPSALFGIANTTHSSRM